MYPTVTVSPSVKHIDRQHKGLKQDSTHTHINK